ncbi:uncharacterized protein LOC105688413 isoform X2 [Athalia rosae]|uniref:uncharacterized protein LOC105688413 isoform X2 n=1 Tax=Athalia rosae TaxID=37344 RepID=UPI002033CC59|nr:uncharacterized protein LOC105688413 isoform X2 [Athalia rosae]
MEDRSGLDNSVLPYVHSFMNHAVNGQQLLNLRPEDLEHLGVLKLGHQETILEAVEYLRNFHYELDRENLQLLALQLSCQAHSLHNELSRQTDSKPVTTQTLSDVAAVVTAVKPLVCWLDRSPFSGQLEYNDKKAELLKLSIEMATCAQRDRFAERPIEEIRTTCGQLAKLADYIIQDIADPMILQPASLDLATLKKRPGDDLGFYILPSFHGAHQIAEIKFGSAAHQCGKMEEGDEIVQVNYQTVVGWERKNVLELFRESPAEVLLTLKRRPRHTKVYGQIYIKPYRLPSNKKTTYTTRWQHNLPSPRPELLTIPDFTMPLPRQTQKIPSPEPASILDTVITLDTMPSDSSDSDSEVEPPSSIRLYSSKPRNLVQRRATITGASPTTKHGVDIEQFWRELKEEHITTFQLRDKAASCAHGLDTVPSNIRPQTYLGIEQSKRKKKLDGHTDDRKVQFQDRFEEAENNHVDDKEKTNQNSHPKLGPQKSISFETNTVYPENRLMDVEFDVSSNTSDSQVPLNESNKNTTDSGIIQDVRIGEPSAHHKERGKLDKSYSTPAYDLTENDFVERKLATIESHSKLSLTSNTSSCCLNKTESLTIDGTLDNDVTKFDDTGHNLNLESENIGNVAQKINNIEKSIRNIDTDGKSNLPKMPEKTESSQGIVHIKINDFDYRNSIYDYQSDIRSIQNHVECKKETCTLKETYVSDDKRTQRIDVEDTHVDNDSQFNHNTSSHESSVEKSESTNSYNENVGSSSDGDTTIKKFGDILETINHALIAHTKLVQVKARSADNLHNNNAVHSNLDVNKTSEYSENSSDTSSTPMLERKISTTSVQNNSCQSRQYADCTTKPEIKQRMTPPEPPPRKYYSKPAPLNLSNICNSSEVQDKPVPCERLNSRGDLKQSESFLDNYVTVDDVNGYQKNQTLETYNDFVEKSTDFIDEPSTPFGDYKPTLLTDPYGYSEIYEGQFKEEKALFEGCDTQCDKIGATNPILIEQHRMENNTSRNMDSPDGVGCSRQMYTPDSKPKTLEKDKSSEKGVVNRAMMVARSIGLHASSSKASGSSPRSSRKRNLLLAKRRNVSVKDVGLGELEGWLTHRSRGAGGAWARAWFVLKGSSLYRFKTQESIKADCLIALTGFTASQATEVKSRKYAFKVYHTGTVFYFAAESDDFLSVWLDAINKATLGAESHGQTSALFSETDESDGENKSKARGSCTPDKPNLDKKFGSLKKLGRKDSGFKEQEISGASLDRKYLRFLGARNQNVPVPTAQFRSYRRVLPTSTPKRKQDLIPHSPDLQVTVAGSTFYGLSSSHSATDVPSSHDMGDYRRTSDRSHSNRSRRTDDLQGFVTLEQFMLSHQEEDRRQDAENRSISPRVTLLTSDHVHIQHRNFNDISPNNGVIYGQTRYLDDVLPTNGVIYGHTRNWDETSSNSSSASYGLTRIVDENHVQGKSKEVNYTDSSEEAHTQNRVNEYTNEAPVGKNKHCQLTHSYKKQSDSHGRRSRPQEGVVYYPNSPNESLYGQNLPSLTEASSPHHNRHEMIHGSNRQMDAIYGQNAHMYGPRSTVKHDLMYGKKVSDSTRVSDSNEILAGLHSAPKRLLRNEGYSGSSGDLASPVSSETLQRARKEASVTRKGSFNLIDCRRDQSTPDKHWMDSLRRTDKKNQSSDKNRLKNAAQYQPPPIPSSPFEQDGMRPAFEMHLDKSEHVQKTNRFKSLFASKNPQKPNTLDLPKDHQKTLLGSPRLHRAIFRDKRTNQQSHQNNRSGSQSPGDSGISQSLSSFSGTSQSQTLSQSFSSTSSVSDWSPDTPTANTPKSAPTIGNVQKRSSYSHRNSLAPPTLPYIPPPTSPPPDYPGLEYPPVFEPGTYSLTDASLIRNRCKGGQTKNDS